MFIEVPYYDFGNEIKAKDSNRIFEIIKIKLENIYNKTIKDKVAFYPITDNYIYYLENKKNLENKLRLGKTVRKSYENEIEEFIIFSVNNDTIDIFYRKKEIANTFKYSKKMKDVASALFNLSDKAQIFYIDEDFEEMLMNAYKIVSERNPNLEEPSLINIKIDKKDIDDIVTETSFISSIKAMFNKKNEEDNNEENDKENNKEKIKSLINSDGKNNYLYMIIAIVISGFIIIGGIGYHYYDKKVSNDNLLIEMENFEKDIKSMKDYQRKMKKPLIKAIIQYKTISKLLELKIDQFSNKNGNYSFTLENKKDLTKLPIKNIKATTIFDTIYINSATSNLEIKEDVDIKTIKTKESFNKEAYQNKNIIGFEEGKYIIINTDNIKNLKSLLKKFFYTLPTTYSIEVFKVGNEFDIIISYSYEKNNITNQVQSNNTLNTETQSNSIVNKGEIG